MTAHCTYVTVFKGLKMGTIDLEITAVHKKVYILSYDRFGIGFINITEQLLNRINLLKCKIA